MNATAWGAVPPAAVPVVGAVLHLAADDWRYNPDGQPVRLLVRKVRHDISSWYDGAWVWVDGAEVTGAGADRQVQVLVRVDALPPAARDGTYQPGQPE